ncbi:MAG: hypothetical protein AVDCRST_MAG43-327, partial [uncultured Thermomicrobiales bacterium]
GWRIPGLVWNRRWRRRLQHIACLSALREENAAGDPVWRLVHDVRRPDDAVRAWCDRSRHRFEQYL